MDNKNPKLLRYIAGGLFAVSLLRSLIGSSGLTFLGVLGWAATALMAAAMFAEKDILLAIGAGLRLPSSLYSIFSTVHNIYYAFNSYYSLFSTKGLTVCILISSLLSLAAVVLLLLAVFKREKARNLCFLSAGLNAAGFVLVCIGYLIGGFLSPRLFFTYLLTIVLNCAPVLLAGYVLQGGPAQTSKPALQAAPVAPAPSDRVEKILKLKALLDSGVLTQEEFDAKKKELLDL